MKYAINLFPPKKKNFADDLFYFVGHYVRYAIVITLAVVLVVFFLRVRVDRELGDEKERLSMRKAIVAVTKPLRADLENMQRKISLIKGVLNKQDTLNAQIDYITNVIPKKSNIQTITINDSSVQIDALTEDFRIIPIFTARLLKDARYESIKVTKVQKENAARYSFSITLENFKDTKSQKAKT